MEQAGGCIGYFMGFRDTFALDPEDLVFGVGCEDKLAAAFGRDFAFVEPVFEFEGFWHADGLVSVAWAPMS